MTYLSLRRPVATPFRFFNTPFTIHRQPTGKSVYTWRPSADITENDDSYEVRAELPGVSKDDVQITVKDNLLSIKGEKRKEDMEEGKNYKRIERRYGSFVRNFTLPPKVVAGNINAEFNNGVLTLSIPKPEGVKPKEIPINTETVVDVTEEN